MEKIKRKTLFFVTISSALCQLLARRGKIAGDPPLSERGRQMVEWLKPFLNHPCFRPAQVHCGTGKRFIEAAKIIFPERKIFYFSPIWGEPAILARLDRKQRLILGCGLAFPKKCLFLRQPAKGNEREVPFLETAVINTAFNLPDNSVVFAESRPLFILGLKPNQFRGGALYAAELASALKPAEFRFFTRAKQKTAEAA